MFDPCKHWVFSQIYRKTVFSVDSSRCSWQIDCVKENNTMSNTMSNAIKINYNTSVYTPAGWRNVGITATATKVSDKMASVLEVLEINGQAPKASMSRTGASRQKFNGCGISRREVGSNKRLSSCTIL